MQKKKEVSKKEEKKMKKNKKMVKKIIINKDTEQRVNMFSLITFSLECKNFFTVFTAMYVESIIINYFGPVIK